MKNIIRIATRNSPLALRQATMVKNLLASDINCELVPMTSSGDTFSSKRFKQHGGKGLFLKELEQSMLQGECDIAVHSLKDVPAVVDDEFDILTISGRENPADVLISNKHNSISVMPENSIIGTSSPRRIAMLKNHSKEFKIVDIRGNIQTRLEKLDKQKIDGIILAAAGIHRMDLNVHIKEYLPIDKFIPSAGQGILCIEFLRKNREIRSILSKHIITNVQRCADIEREFVEYLEGDCMSPIGIYAMVENKKIKIKAFVSSLDGEEHIKTTYETDAGHGGNPGKDLAKAFLKQGARRLLNR